jgi:hypothetical protein
MRARSYKRPSRPSNDAVPTNSYVQEALAKQAASRPPRTPAKLMPVTPTLPKVYKPKGRRRRTV